MEIAHTLFANIGNEPILQYTLTNDAGMTLKFLTFGARVQQMRLPNAAGLTPNLTIGFITLQDYLNQPGLFGAAIGPDFHASRTARTGWQNWNWAATTAQTATTVSVTFSLTLSEQADQTPGTQQVAITHTLDQANHWTVAWQIESDVLIHVRPGLNLAFLLTGDPAQTVLHQAFTLDGKKTPLPVADEIVPASTATLADRDWQLALTTDAPGLALSTFPEIDDDQTFNGILGQPHMAVGMRPLPTPEDHPVAVGPGQPFARQSTFTLTAN